MRPYLRVANVFENRIDTSDIMEMNFDPGEFERFALAPGDVLLNEGQSLDLVGRPAMYRGEVPGACFTNTLVRFRPMPGVSPEFALAMFRHFLHTGKFQPIARWTTNIAHLGAGRFAQMACPLAPTAEQDRLTSELASYESRLDDAVATLKRVQQNLDRYRASVLKAAVEGRLVPTEAELARQEGRDYEPASVLLERILDERRRRWIEDAAEKARAKAEEKAKKAGRRWTSTDGTKTLELERAKAARKYQEPGPPDTCALPDLPEGWCCTTVEAVAELRLGKMLDKAKNKGELRPYLRNANVRWFAFDLSDLLKMRVTDGELSEVSVVAGDLVVCEGGEPGRCAVWHQAGMPTAIQKALHRVRPHTGLSAWYLACVLRADSHSGKLDEAFTGSTIKHLTGEALASYAIPLPPENEQTRIVEAVRQFLSVADSEGIQIDKGLARSGRLRQSILKWAFEGKLVPQDPNDEPASVLLERIKAERERMGAKKKRNSRVGRPKGTP